MTAQHRHPVLGGCPRSALYRRRINDGTGVAGLGHCFLDLDVLVVRRVVLRTEHDLVEEQVLEDPQDPEAGDVRGLYGQLVALGIGRRLVILTTKITARST